MKMNPGKLAVFVKHLVQLCFGLVVFFIAPAADAASQTITFPEIANKAGTDAPFALAATASSGLPVSYAVVSSGGVATISGDTATLTGVAGSVTIVGMQPGGGGFDPAAAATRTFLVRSASAFVKTACGCYAEHIVGIRADGTLWAWGSNSSGQLGDGTTTQRTSPVQVGTATNWQSIAAGPGYTVAVKSDGTLWAWGSNKYGLGDGTTAGHTNPVQVGTATNWQSVTAGFLHMVAVKSDGTLWSWGYNGLGQLGDGTTTPRLSPVQVGTATNWQSVAAGHHTIAIKTDGTLWAWGYNGQGQLGDGTTTDRHTPVQVGTATNWQSIAAGASHTVAIMTDGTLWTWGLNTNGQLGDGTTTQRTSPVQVGTATTWQSIAAGASHTVAIKTDGTLWAWGLNTNGQLGDGTTTQRTSPVQMGTATNWQSIAAGASHTVAVKSDGTLWAWGSGSHGQLASNSLPVSLHEALGSQTVVSVAAGASHSLCVKSDGTLWAWGSNNYGQLGNGTTTQSINPVQVGTATNWQSIAAGSFHTVGIRADGTLWAWGRNSSGQLGDGSTTQRTSPVQVGTATNWQSIAAGVSHTMAIKTDGTLWAWGLNTNGRLGDGSTTQQNSPVQVGIGTNWQSVVAGDSHTLAVKNDGTLWAWGRNSSGELGDGTTTQRTSPVQVGTATTWQSIAAGASHTVAIKTDGTLWAWGLNTNGQLGDGTTTQRTSPVQMGTATNWQSIAAGASYTVAVKSDGTLWAWGLNTSGQLGDGTATSQAATPQQVGTVTGWALVKSGSSASHTLATRSSRLWGFGENSESPLPGGDLGRIVPRLSVPARSAQTVSIPTFTAILDVPVVLAATATSGLPVSYAVSGPATLSGNVLTVTGNGEVILDAWQTGDDNAWQYSALASVVVSPDIGVEQVIDNVLTDGATTIGFGSVGVGTSSAAKTFTIRNTSTASALTSLAINKDGTENTDFTVNTVGMLTTLTPGATTTFSVTFNPSVPGARSAAIHIASNVTGTKNPFDIALTGNGQTFFQAWAATNGVANDPNAVCANGQKNVVNFAFGLSPTTGGGGPLAFNGTLAGGMVGALGLPLVWVEPTGNGTGFSALFIRRKDAALAGLTYTVEFSADVTTWSPSVTAPTPLADNGTYQIMGVAYPPLANGAQARFSRVRVTLAP